MSVRLRLCVQLRVLDSTPERHAPSFHSGIGRAERETWGQADTDDADGERLTRTANGTTTVYIGGLYAEDLQTGITRTLYPFNGQVIAQRSTDSSGLISLHGDHRSRVSLATSASGAVVRRQAFDPWGAIRSGGIPQTALNDTGQRRDGTGLLYYHARSYDPVLARFVSADSVVPRRRTAPWTAWCSNR